MSDCRNPQTASKRSIGRSRMSTLRFVSVLGAGKPIEVALPDVVGLCGIAKS